MQLNLLAISLATPQHLLQDLKVRQCFLGRLSNVRFSTHDGVRKLRHLWHNTLAIKLNMVLLAINSHIIEV